MIDDSRNLPRSTTIRGDVCVVGAGPAGLALALELERSGVRVVLLESGGFVPEYRVQKLARAVNAGLPYFPLDANRQRALGGTSRLWAGWCRPFTRWDMTPRLWVDESTWPISIDDLEPFYSPALRFLGLENPNFELPFWEDACRSHRIAVDEGDAFTGIYQLTEPSFARENSRPQLAASDRITTLLHAQVVEIETSKCGKLVDGLAVRSLRGGQFRVEAHSYVLGMGAIEIPRLLLASSRNSRSGVGNEYDLVGRYFMEHLVFDYGEISLAQAGVISPLLYASSGTGLGARLFLSHASQEREAVLQVCTQFAPLDAGPAPSLPHRVGRRAKVTFADFALKQRIKSYGVGRRNSAWTSRTSGNGAEPIPVRAFDSVRLTHITEQAPNPESRVLLDEQKRDALGLPQARLEWRTLPIDERTAEVARRFAGQAFEKAGLGSFSKAWNDDSQIWPPRPLQGLRGHHMGTTRMAAEARKGVVDAQCKVHGVENLYIASSSVFVTAGAGVPTGTIVAMALRLAGTIKRRLKER